MLSFRFKRERFEFHAESLLAHARSLGIEHFQFQYIGVNDPPTTVTKHAQQGESNTLWLYREAPLGEGSELQANATCVIRSAGEFQTVLSSLVQTS